VAPMSPVDPGRVYGETEMVELTPYGQSLLRIAEIPTISSDSILSSTPRRHCVAPSPSHSIEADVPLMSLTFDCSPWSNATANFNWTAESQLHSGLATFDGYQHWIDLYQPNQGVWPEPSIPSILPLPLSINLSFVPMARGSFCMLDLTAGAHLDNFQVCCEKELATVIWSVWVGSVEGRVVAQWGGEVGRWVNVVVSVDVDGSLSVSVDGRPSVSGKGAGVPNRVARKVASVGRQSAPGNDGFGLFTGMIDAITISTRTTSTEDGGDRVSVAVAEE
jgi:hypothetical protein